MTNIKNISESELTFVLMGAIKVYNLTPHTLNVIDRDGNVTVIPASGAIARVATEEILVGRLGFSEVVQRRFGDVDWGFDMPQMKKDTVYIVSSLVASAIKDRHDILVPGTLVRNDEGQPIGCKGFAMV